MAKPAPVIGIGAEFMVRQINKLAILAKLETLYGVNALPDGAANAMQVNNCKYDVGHEEVARDLMLPYMGHRGVILVGKHVVMSFDVEIAGPGVEGVLPAWGALLRMCGFSEELIDTDVVYLPRSTAFEAGTFYYNLDGVNHVALGVRGNVKLSLKPKEIPRFTFEVKGLLGTIEDAALPAVTFPDFGVPVVVSKANTAFSLHGYAGATESIAIDLGGMVEPRLVINHESIEYVERKATGEAVMDATTLAIKNWFAIANAHQTGEMHITHGTAPGNIIKIDAPAVQVGIPKYQSSQKVAAQALKLFLRPSSAGNDELVITVPGAAAASAWIFGSGVWSDSGHWQDFRPWDMGLFLENKWWDGGSWSDAKVW